MVYSNGNLSDVQRLVLRLYAKNEAISIREIAKVIIRPNKTMLGRWVIQFEKDGLITRTSDRHNMKVFLTAAGRKAML